MIKVFCCFYREAVLIPFFLAHYHFVHAIHAIVDESPDDTRALLAADPRVTIQDVSSPNGIDDDLKVEWLNAALAEPDPVHAWHLVVDADELLWPPDDPSGGSAEGYLSAVPADDEVLLAKMVDVYRHVDDADLDVTSLPIGLQRRHGSDRSDNTKPIVIRSNMGFAYRPGNHTILGDPTISQTHHFDGAHWQNADPSFAVDRRIRDRKERMSANNIHKRHGWHHWTLTADDVREELESHRHDDQRF